MDLQVDSLRIERTKDGSYTLFSVEHDSHYHSIYGAIQESQHVFIKEGLSRCRKRNIKILEIGFGSGLNALLSSVMAEENGLEIDYHALELYPLPLRLVEKLEYCAEIGLPRFKDLFISMHTAPWNEFQDIHENFRLTKYNKDLLKSIIPNEVDVVFFDAFGPRSQPELWTAEVFNKIYASMNSDGILSTYCCKGEVRRAMLSVGFKVEKVPGPPGKREMLVAIK